MSKSFKIFFSCFLVLLAIAVCSGCSASRKNPWLQKKKQASKVNASQLGRNRYYFSPRYQKKLSKGYKRK
ncbi:MAG: hypothetical protein ABSG89_09685 [Bacteroidales bacterium]